VSEKIFEVLSERVKDESKEVEQVIQYVSCADLMTVADYFTQQCEQVGEDLKSIREVLTVSQHID